MRKPTPRQSTARGTGPDRRHPLRRTSPSPRRPPAPSRSSVAPSLAERLRAERPPWFLSPRSTPRCQDRATARTRAPAPETYPPPAPPPAPATGSPARVGPGDVQLSVFGPTAAAIAASAAPPTQQRPGRPCARLPHQHPSRGRSASVGSGIAARTGSGMDSSSSTVTNSSTASPASEMVVRVLVLGVGRLHYPPSPPRVRAPGRPRARGSPAALVERLAITITSAPASTSGE